MIPRSHYQATKQDNHFSGIHTAQFKCLDILTSNLVGKGRCQKSHKPLLVKPCKNLRPCEKPYVVLISGFTDTFLVPYLCSLRKGFSTQHALWRLVDTWKELLGKKEVAGALLMDLSKAFDYIEHEL